MEIRIERVDGVVTQRITLTTAEYLQTLDCPIPVEGDQQVMVIRE